MEASSARSNTSQFPELLRRFAAQMADHQRTQLARRLHDAREAQSLSREDLAYKSGVNVKTIKRIEHKEHDPRPSTVRRLAEGLGMSPGELRPDPAIEVDRLERLEGKLDEILARLRFQQAEQLSRTAAERLRRELQQSLEAPPERNQEGSDS